MELKSDEWDQKVVELARVTRVTKGGKRMRFRACVLVGNRKGQVGLGVAKGADVSMAVNKATNQAQKRIIDVPIVGDSTIPHRITQKFGASIIMLKPAPKGSGIIAGGVVRLVLELAGVENVVSKTLGAKNKINNCKATLDALVKLNLLKDKVVAKLSKKAKPVVQPGLEKNPAGASGLASAEAFPKG